MSKNVVIVFLTVICISLSVSHLFNSEPLPQVNANETTPSGNGDVNGSGSIDISDAIYLLTYLFGEGPEPVEIDGGNGSCPLPATGQTTCYNEAGGEIDCTSVEYPGQDGFYQKGYPTEGRFVDNGDGTVTDNCTGLTWQQTTADIPDDNDDRVTWAEALRYCEALE